MKKLKIFAEDTLVTQQPHKQYKNKFEATSLNFEGYTDLFTTIDALLKVCILATQEDQHQPPFVKSTPHNICTTLKLVSKLLPFTEVEFLDKDYALLKTDEEDG